MVVVGCPAINNVRKCSLYNYVKSSLAANYSHKSTLAILSVQSLSIKLIIIYGLFYLFPKFMLVVSFLLFHFLLLIQSIC